LRSRIINPSNEVANQVAYNCYLAQFEPKKMEEALQDDSWVIAMHDECCEFKRVLASARIICNIECASARSNPQGNGQKSVSCLINHILT
jgi:hypothetical protein